MVSNKVTSMEHLVPEESYRKSRVSRLFLIAALFVISAFAIVMTCLFAWKVNETKASNPSSYAKVRQTAEANEVCPEYPHALPDVPTPLSERLQVAIDKISSFLKEQVNREGLPAISSTIYYKDVILWTGHYGKKTLGGEKPDNNTRYRIGSISKVFSVLMVYILYEKGIIQSIDDPLSKYAPDFVINNPFTGENITLRQIMKQEAGLPREAPCVLCNNNETTAQQLMYLRNQSLVVEPGTVPSYSNLGYALLGRLLTEKLLNTTFEEWTKANILTPLGLQHTGFTINKDVKSNMAFPYDNHGNVMPFLDIGWLSPSGQMYSTIKELAQFAMFLTGGIKNDKIGLKRSSLNEIFSPSHIAPDSKTAWGSPWEMFVQKGFLLRTKGGSIDNMSAIMAIIPELQLGFNVFFSTVSNNSRSAFISNDAVDKFTDEFLPVFNQTLFELNENGSFPVDPTPYIGTFNITIVNLYAPTTTPVQHARATIINKGVSLYYSEEGVSRRRLSLYYVNEKLVLQARRLGRTCFLQRMGSLMTFYFKPFVNGSRSTGFAIPHYGITAIRAD